jgi:hypothetical protein
MELKKKKRTHQQLMPQNKHQRFSALFSMRVVVMEEKIEQVAFAP